jgi:hypothetical protein
MAKRLREDDGRSTERTDQAALMGTTLAAVLALVLAPGAWDLPSTMFGLALLCVLQGYYRISKPPSGSSPSVDFARDKREAHRRAYALAAVAGLCAALALAYPMQLSTRLPGVDTFIRRGCSVQVRPEVSAAFLDTYNAQWAPTSARYIAKEREKDLIEECVASRITRYGVPVVWLITVLVVPRCYMRRWKTSSN